MLTLCYIQANLINTKRIIMCYKKMTKKGQYGFTLVELLIVMIILGLLAALAGPRLIQKVGSSKVKAAQTQISLFETALDAYRLDVGSYPSDDQGLAALNEDPGISGWDGPYLSKDIPTDPWNNPYVYEKTDDSAEYAITSLGADGAPGGEGENADLSNRE